MWIKLRPYAVVFVGVWMLGTGFVTHAGDYSVEIASAQQKQPAEPNALKEPDEAQSTAGCVVMDNQRLGTLLEKIATNVEGGTGYWKLTYQGLEAQIITDENADRMRIIIPLAEAGELNAEQLTRLMQANFESALDARYAVAQGFVWSTFIHGLSTLSEEELISGLAQTFNVAFTYGTSFSSGLFNYGGGDNGDVFRDIIEKGLRT